MFRFSLLRAMIALMPRLTRVLLEGAGCYIGGLYGITSTTTVMSPITLRRCFRRADDSLLPVYAAAAPPSQPGRLPSCCCRCSLRLLMPHTR